MEVQEVVDYAGLVKRSRNVMYHPDSTTSYVRFRDVTMIADQALGSQISQAAGMLTTEYGTASNIKSRVNRSASTSLRRVCVADVV
jgi:hypothetical protein